jgi:hypothetical protein
MYFGRGKNKVTKDYGFEDIYKQYKELSKNPLEKKLVRKVLMEFNTEILRHVVYDGYDFSMGYRLGSIRIKKFNNALRLNKEGEIANKLRVDWEKTKKKWEELYPGKSPKELKQIKNKVLIFHLNEHTDNYVFRWFWDKVTCNLLNQSAYFFEPIRPIKREAAKAWKEIPGLKNIYYE